MNTNDPFEQKLQRQPRRQLPSTWRDEILAAARRAATPSPGLISNESACTFFDVCRSRLANLLWPHPTAWAGLVASWLLILGLNLAARDPAAPRLARQTVPPSPQLRALLRQQEQLFAELVGPMDKSAAEAPRRAVPQPRSQRRDEFLHA